MMQKHAYLLYTTLYYITPHTDTHAHTHSLTQTHVNIHTHTCVRAHTHTTYMQAHTYTHTLHTHTHTLHTHTHTHTNTLHTLHTHTHLLYLLIILGYSQTGQGKFWAHVFYNIFWGKPLSTTWLAAGWNGLLRNTGPDCL